MKRKISLHILPALLAVLLLTACGTEAAPSQSESSPAEVTTTAAESDTETEETTTAAAESAAEQTDSGADSESDSKSDSKPDSKSDPEMGDGQSGEAQSAGGESSGDTPAGGTGTPSGAALRFLPEHYGDPVTDAKTLGEIEQTLRAFLDALNQKDADAMLKATFPKEVCESGEMADELREELLEAVEGASCTFAKLEDASIADDLLLDDVCDIAGMILLQRVRSKADYEITEDTLESEQQTELYDMLARELGYDDADALDAAIDGYGDGDEADQFHYDLMLSRVKITAVYDVNFSGTLNNEDGTKDDTFNFPVYYVEGEGFKVLFD